MSAISEVSENSQVPWDGGAGGELVPAGGQRVPGGRHRAVWRPAGSGTAASGTAASGAAGSGAAGSGTVLDEVTAARAWAEAGLVTRSGCQYAGDRRRQPVALLQAGSTGVPGGLDLAALRASCRELIVNAVDDDSPVSRAARGTRPGPVPCALGDLRTVPLLPRSYDLVDCCLLLHRIQHAELVLDRIVEALKPGGLLLLRTGDRDCAAGFLDRVLPLWVRRAGWRFGRPGQPGPYPAVYEELASARGIQSYVARRGLVIVRRESLSGPAAGRRRAGPLSARSVTAWLSRGSLTAAHDELVYVIRRPEDRSARLL